MDLLDYWALIPGLLLIIGYGFYRWSIATFDYFERRSVPYRKPIPLFGNFWHLFTGKIHSNDVISEGYRLFPNARFSGVFAFRRPGYLIHDPELIKQITIKDFDHFTDHANNLTEDVDPLVGRALFFNTGNHWRLGRSGLSPAFTGSKMRNMFELISTYSEGVLCRLAKGLKVERLEREMKDFIQRFATDVISSISLGVEVDSIHDSNNDFFTYGQRLISTKGIQGFKLFVLTMLPAEFFTTLGIKIVPKDVADFYEHTVATTIAQREQLKIVRPDFIHLLTLARKNKLKAELADDKSSSFGFSTVKEYSQALPEDIKSRWTDMDIAAAAATFFVGGIDTTTSTLCFALYEMALNPQIQEKLRSEIDNARENIGNQNLSYDVLQQMKYLDMVMSETLRRWPPIGVTNRKCTKPYQMKNSDGTSVTVEKDQLIEIPIQAVHWDERIYPDPLRFDPDRFSDENRAKINQNAYLPFGSGPRNCIGSRLALMQAKCFLFYLLAYFTVEMSQRTTVPIQLDKRSFSIDAVGGFWFHLTPRVDKLPKIN
ncbi:cytochrome P450 9e2-like [Wyeomyia smithii]|uniref:cytochrome P450 9e2-like n=1 Tax=Wyeomyia smithii TaxID=174621 RepID=UPI00246804C6|nr:cytochrome P450 9e2-like [Wyeomyia smithii]